MDNNEKERRFQFPLHGTYRFGRQLSTAGGNDVLWTAVQEEKNGVYGIAVVRQAYGGPRHVFHLDTEFCHRTSLAAVDDGVFITWNEAYKGGWRIQCTSISNTGVISVPAVTVHSSENLLLPPYCAYRDGLLWIAWSELTNAGFRIAIFRQAGNRWEPVRGVPVFPADAFRPQLALNSDGLYLVHDQYRYPRYEVILDHFDGKNWKAAEILSHETENWFHPKIIAGDRGRVYLCWLASETVKDDRGVVDHRSFGMTGRYSGGKVYLLKVGIPENDGRKEERITCDLREGLLAAEVYKGYIGLRRNPLLSLSGDGAPVCLWEVRFESDKSAVAGHLAGRKLGKDGKWNQPLILHNGGYAYSVPSAFSNTLPVGFLKFDEQDHRIIRTEFLTWKEHSRTPYCIDGKKWRRWKSFDTEPSDREKREVNVKNRLYRLYWADTHCHSIFSPDAEGEVDELIHFGRDTAGLDVMCIIDNDFYPHKALSEAEWRVHQELADRYTEEGVFVLFPGYEFTNHEMTSGKGFNHRCIIYPRKGGQRHLRIDPDVQNIEGLYKKLNGTEVMCYPHHCCFELANPAFEWNVEICSSWRVCMEETDFVRRVLGKGEKFGFIGSSDSHRAVPGLGGALTGIFAESLTPEALFDAYRHRRTIATQGNLLFADFRVADLFIGEEGTCEGPPSISASIQSPCDIEFAEIIRDGRPIFRSKIDGDSHDLSFKDDTVQPGGHYYFLRIKLEGDPSFNSEDPLPETPLVPFTLDSRYPHNLCRASGPFAWTSPIWVTKT